jgi:type I restriction enzyme M protein
MGNEAKTENIFRTKIRKLGYYDDENIIIEEKQSDNPIIRKLLSKASKRGKGTGYPEFIIRSKKDSNFLIVVECKASITKHQSETLNNFADYAVDGARLYSAYLSNQFDVIAIGISGERESSMRISHFLQLSGEDRCHNFLGHEILKFDDYIHEYRISPYKFIQDYQKLLDYTQDLNETLHAKKIKENQRSLLISGILISLQNRAFRDSYSSHRTARQLANNLLETITSELVDANIPDVNMRNLKQAFTFITTNTTLTGNLEFLIHLINEIDERINSFIKTYSFFDTIGQFYIEFLRYANNDKGLGIVLTPPHITDLFVELAYINRDSIVLDNCCGTGGFLISAMRKMISQADGDSDRINKIKENQIIGIEYQDDIYALAVSNMIIHQDGKSNIYAGDCFREAKTLKDKFKPTVGLLNPPYKTKKGDTEELEFILNNLDMLDTGGKCVAIIPMSCVLAQKGYPLEMKTKLLKNHTLEAVMSMPDELFHNSEVGVVTCTIVITAHIPHPQNKKTWFGYWKNDGFVKMKKRGRIDSENRWEQIKEFWLSSFHNREVIMGHSIMQKVEAGDEWCAEAYMETDYTNIQKDDFIKEIKKYVLFKELYLK